MSGKFTKQKVLEIIKRKTEGLQDDWGRPVVRQFDKGQLKILNDLKGHISQLDEPVTLEEVKAFCEKNTDNTCDLRKGLINCQISKDPCKWDITAITKAIRKGH